MSISALEHKLKEAKATNSLPKIVIPVHLCGQSCDMEAVWQLGQEYGFRIIEDASHALGGSYQGEPVGSCRYSDITVFSFHPVKIITSGEGGMSLTNSDQIAERMWRLRTHGITNSRAAMAPRAETELWNYQQIELGFNYRMNDLEAALGLSQMSNLDAFIEARHQIAKRYNAALSTQRFVLPKQLNDSYSSYHLYPIRLRSDFHLSQTELYARLRTLGVMVNLHYIPVYRHPYYEQLGFKPNYCPEAERYHRDALSLPIFPRPHSRTTTLCHQYVKFYLINLCSDSHRVTIAVLSTSMSDFINRLAETRANIRHQAMLV